MEAKDGKSSTKIVKQSNKLKGKNSPVIGNNGLMVEPGDNANILAINIELFNLPNIDINNVDDVTKRLTEYFEVYARHDMKPTVAGMAIALNGHSRTWLWAVTHDGSINGNGDRVKLPLEVANVIKKAYFMLENQWETYMNSGKINPVSGIFLGKNNFGYKDKNEYVVTPNIQNDNDYNADEIRQRYLIDSGNTENE